MCLYVGARRMWKLCGSGHTERWNPIVYVTLGTIQVSLYLSCKIEPVVIMRKWGQQSAQLYTITSTIWPFFPRLRFFVPCDVSHIIWDLKYVCLHVASINTQFVYIYALSVLLKHYTVLCQQWCVVTRLFPAKPTRVPLNYFRLLTIWGYNIVTCTVYSPHMV